MFWPHQGRPHLQLKQRTASVRWISLGSTSNGTSLPFYLLMLIFFHVTYVTILLLRRQRVVAAHVHKTVNHKKKEEIKKKRFSFQNPLINPGCALKRWMMSAIHPSKFIRHTLNNNHSTISLSLSRVRRNEQLTCFYHSEIGNQCQLFVFLSYGDRK